MTPIRHVPVLDLIDRLYDAVLHVGRWGAFLEALTEVFGGLRAKVLHADHRNRVVAFCETYIHPDYAPPKLQARYADYAFEDPRALVGLPAHSAAAADIIHAWHPEADSEVSAHFANHGVLSHRMVCTDAALAESRVYREFLGPLNCEHTAMVRCAEPPVSSVCAVMRGREHAPFGPADLDDLLVLAPHIKHALRLHRRWGLGNPRSTELFAALDSIPLAILICRLDGTLVFVNQAAKVLDEEDDGVSLRDDRLRFHHGSIQRAWLDLLGRAAVEAVSKGIARAESFRIPRHSGRVEYRFWVVALRVEALQPLVSEAAEPLVVAIRTDGGGLSASPVYLASHLFRLTHSETEVLEALLLGYTVRQVARSLSVAESTVRTHLKSLFAKTDTHRQLELLLRVLSSPTVLVPSVPKKRKS